MSPDAEYTIREATLADIPLLLEARHNMYVDLGDVVVPEDRDRVDFALADYLAAHASAGPIGFIAEDETDALVGAVSITHEQTQPSRPNLSGRQAYLYGMWVRPESRRRGCGAFARGHGRRGRAGRGRRSGDADGKQRGQAAVRGTRLQRRSCDAALVRPDLRAERAR